MENKYNGFEIKSDAQYKDISSISFTPIQEIKTTRKYKKGNWRFWKWLGLVPLIPYKVTRDLHESNSWDGLKSLEKIRDNSYHIITAMRDSPPMKQQLNTLTTSRKDVKRWEMN